MDINKFGRLAVALVILFIVTTVAERDRRLAGILATMPVNITLALWVFYANSNSDSFAAADLAQGMVIGLIPTMIFIVVVWLTMSRGWSLLGGLAAGYGTWLVGVGISQALRWFWR